ncbi:hypothetical protein WG922_04315 [Ramlibacter sp. AN1015]|uniref:hypothetical protein n=1 Tax=Ramlibacter sp. AN1015 TaxID=3133428 RepID=UPI0030C5C9BF
MSERRAWFARLRLQHVLAVLLAAWALGLAIAAIRLQPWQQEVSRVLIQLRADDLLRSSVRQWDQVHPEWYRKRALALLSAVERLRHDTAWSLVMPGSWRLFDDLEERAAERIDSAFASVVVETIRRELDSRAALLAGLPQHPATGEIDTGAQCSAPTLRGAGPQRTVASTEGDAEDAALLQHLQEVQQLDQAVAALLALRDPATARAEDMRMLVRYSLRAELSGPASRGLRLFHAHAALPAPQAEALVGRLRWAVWCSVTKGAEAAQARWFERNELLALEERLNGIRASTLFAPSSAVGLAASRERLRSTAALIARQQALLARGSHQWMRSDTLPPSSVHVELVRRVAQTHLLGPDLAARLQAQAHVGHAQFRKRFDAHFARPDAGLAWHPLSGRYALAPQRAALGEGLALLVAQPFMADAEPTSAVLPAGYGSFASAAAADTTPSELSELAQQRRRFMRETLPVFPKPWHALVTRYVEDRVLQRAYEQSARFVAAGAAVPPPFMAPMDVAWQRVRQVEAALQDAGSPRIAGQVRERLEREVLAPLALASAAARPPTQVLLPAPVPLYGN